MALPGKLTIGFLNEDNPLKSFFRMKPLLTEEAEGLTPSNIDERFPEEGYIRIVPDKNEIALFKTRMRQLGRYCALDLRKHLSDNDKIRPNKNYVPGGPEHNANIVYSDVIGRVPPQLIAEVIDTDQRPVDDRLTIAAPMPGTMYVVLRRGDELSGPWGWSYQETEEGEGSLALRHAQDQPFSELSTDILEGKTLRVPLDDGEALLLHDMGPFELGEVTLPEFERAPDPMFMGYDPRQPQMMPERRAPIEGFRGMEATIAPELQSKSESAPWLVRSDFLRPRVVNTRLSLREQAMQAQTGINPRRGRSLHEVVDEQWRKSRYDQLGHPVPSQATGRPIASPIERAANAVNEAWALNEARPGLVSELLKIDQLKDALAKDLKLPEGAPGTIGDLNNHLNDLEANRLKLISEIDALRIKRDETKAQLMEELRKTHLQELSQYERRIKTLKTELERNEQAAKSASQAAELASQLLKETDAQLDERLKTSVVGQRMMELMRHARDGGRAPISHPETYEPTAGELISNLRVQLERAGFQLSNDEAVNLLACLMAGGTMIFSGVSGSGKSELSRRLADALGLSGAAGRFVEARTPDEESVKRLLRQDDRITPRLLLLDDFNTGDCEARMSQILELQESIATKDTPLALILTAQDAPEGRALPARLLSRSFLIRLKGASASSPWKPSDLQAPAPERAVSLDALGKIFAPAPELPSELTERLAKLRGELAKFNWALDRRTLNELWHYCASTQALMQCSSLELLDLALSQRALPTMLASMELDALHELPNLLPDMPRCLSLMDQPLPLPPL